MSLTDTQLAAMRQRAEDATPGPWSLDPLKGKYYGTVVRMDAETSVNVWGNRLGQISPREEWFEDVMCDGHYEDLGDYSLAVFIANARTDVPLLLDEVARLTAENAAREAALTHLQGLVREWREAEKRWDGEVACEDTSPEACSRYMDAVRALTRTTNALAAYGAPNAP